MMGGKSMEEVDLDTKVKFIHGFSNRIRIQILDCIKENEKTVSEIVAYVDGNQSNISQHLACLRGCGIITSRQEGKFTYYSLSSDDIKELLTKFDTVLEKVALSVTSCERTVN